MVTLAQGRLVNSLSYSYTLQLLSNVADLFFRWQRQKTYMFKKIVLQFFQHTECYSSKGKAMSHYYILRMGSPPLPWWKKCACLSCSIWAYDAGNLKFLEAYGILLLHLRGFVVMQQTPL